MKSLVFCNNRTGRRLFFGLSGGLFVFFVLSYFFLPSFLGLLWNGYYTVLLDSKIDIDEASRKLRGAGLENVVTASTATVEFSGFDRTEIVSLRDLPKRLSPEDPRYDAFMKSAAKLFVSGSGGEQIVYVRARMSPLLLSMKLAGLFERSSWAMVEWQLGRRFVMLGFFLVIAGIMVFRCRGRRFAAFAFSLPWFNFLIHGSPAGFAAGSLLYIGVLLFIEEAWPVFEHALHYGNLHEIAGLRDRAAYFAVAAVAAAFLVLYPEGNPAALLPLLFGIGGDLSLFGLMAVFSSRRRDLREHRLFLPVAILSRSRKAPWRHAPRYREKALAAAFFLILLAPFAVKFSGGGDAAAIPKPTPAAGVHGSSLEALKDLWMFRREDTPPDFSDYLCHRAFQDGFLYGAVWTFPSVDSGVAVKRYVEENGKIRKTAETVAQYDEAWYKEVLKSSKKTGLGDLLSRQGSRDVVLESAGSLNLNAAFFLRHAVVVAFAFLPLLFAGFGFASSFAPTERDYGLRRKQQEA